MAGPEPAARVHVHVVGRVQGVGFRYATQDEARARGLGGWVRNLESGGVEAVFEGPRPALEQLVAWCRQGPPGAYVRSVRAVWDEPVEGLADFRILATAW